MKSLSVVLLLTATAACGGAAVKPSSDPAGRIERLHIGSLEAYALSDGYLSLPNDGKALGYGRPPSETAAVLAAAGLPTDTVRLDLQALLVKDGDRVLLFDTGLGRWATPENGHLLQSLARAGVAPSAVTDIFISHAHTDHVGGLITKDGAPVFPAAAIHFSAPEWAAFSADSDPDAKLLVGAIGAKVATFEPGAQILPSVRAVATMGHTPGHSSYEIGAAPDTVFYLGDVAHHSIISVQRPAWSIEFDQDRPAAEAMRQSTLAGLASTNARVFAFHFPFPGVGHVGGTATSGQAGPVGQGLVWKPEGR